MLSRRQENVRDIRERTEALYPKLDKALAKYFPQIQLDEFKRERFESMLETNARWEMVLAETKKNCLL